MAKEEVFSLIDADPPERYRFDYRGMHRYHITLPVYAGKSIFVTQDNVAPALDALRDSAFAQRFDVYAYCFMPDKLVMIVRGKDTDSQMKEFLANFRRNSSSALEARLGHPLWKKKYLERVLRKNEDSRRIADAMFEMPVTAGLVKTASEYPFHGSFVVIPRDSKKKRSDFPSTKQ
ncbi:MAG: hypothetical protein HY961_00395 [Ignavibacteriae bacterium]|nr:hypothetical protein [Ignavibacteriota bacterium]